MRKCYWLSVGLLLHTLVWHLNAKAQTGPSPAVAGQALKALGAQEDTVALNGLYENMEPATQIAPSLLGIGAQNVSTPGGLQDISLSVLQSFANLPKQGSGVGIEFSPVQLLEKTTYRPTKRDRLIARFLGIAPLHRDSVAYRSLQEYRRTYWRRGFTLSGASVGDSVASRLAAGISYTFGAGQLDPFKAAGYSEDITQQVNALLVKGSINPFLAVNAAFVKQQGEAVLQAVQEANITTATFPVEGSYQQFLQYITDQLLALPQLNSLDTTATKRAVLLKEYSADTLRKRLTTYLNSRPELSATQRQQFSASLEESLFKRNILQGVLVTYQAAVKPLFRDVGTLLKLKSQAFERDNWNAPLLQVGFGQVWRSADHSWSGLSRQSVHGFIRGSYRPPKCWPVLNRHMQLIGNFQYVYQATDSLQQQVGYGLRLLAGNERLRFSVEGSWKYQRYRAGEKPAQDPNTINRFTVGLEVRMADNLWLEMAIGRTNAAAIPGQVVNKASILTLADLKYGFRNHRRFAVR